MDNMPFAGTPLKRAVTSRALRVALIYGVFAALWICFSDEALAVLSPKADELVKWSLVKGLAFVGVTSGLLLLLMKRTFGQVESGYEALRATEAERLAHETEVVRMCRLYAALSQVNQAIVWTPDRELLLEKICKVLVEFGEFRMAWIGWHSESDCRLLPVASWGDENGYLESIRIYTDDRPEARGPSGTAFRENRSYICNDMLCDQAALPWREEFVRRGYRASAAFPIRAGGVVCGTLTVYSDESGFFKDKEIALLEEAAVDISFALENIANDHERRKSDSAASSERLFSDTMIESMPGILCLYDGRGTFLRWNRNLETVSGYDHGEIQKMSPGDLFSRSAGDAWEDSFLGITVEAFIVAKDGGTLPYFLTGSPVVFNGADCFLIVGIDASEKLRTQEIEKRMAAIVNSSEDAIIAKSLDGVITNWNPGAEKLFGYSTDEVVGRKMLILFPEDRVNEEAELIEKIGRGESVVHFETERVRKDGRRIKVSLTLSPISDGAGRIIGASKIARDITARIEAEMALKASEERYRTTLDSMMEGCQIIGFDWRYLYLNTVAATHNRRPNEELLGRGFLEVWPGIEHTSLFEPLRECMEEREARHHEIEFNFPDGTSGWFDVRCHPVPEGVFILSIDITERRQVQNSLRESEEKFRQLAESVNEVFWLTDPTKAESLYISPAYERIWGDTCESFLRLPGKWLDTVHPDDRARVTESVRTRQLTGEYDEIYRIIRPDGGQRWIHDRAFPILNNEGEVYRVAGIAKDITAEKNVGIELARSNRALRMLGECGEALTRETDESTLLVKICDLAVATGGYQMAWVGYAAADEERLIHPMSHAGAENGYLRSIKLTWDEDSPFSKGPAGRTVLSGKAVICPDIELEAEMFPWRAKALEHGYRSVICLPLRDGDRTFGILSLHSSQVNEAGADEIRLLHDMADDLAFGIVSIRSQNERRRMESAMRKVAASVSASANAGFFSQLAVNMVDASGGQGGIIAQLSPDHPNTVRTIAAVTNGDVIDNFEYQLEGTPCLRVTSSCESFVVTSKLLETFPDIPRFPGLDCQSYVGRRLVNSGGETVGLICVLFTDPLDDEEFVSSTLRIFATRAAAELERLDSDERIREQASLLEKARDAIIVCDLEHRILYWNRSAERLHGWTASEAIGRVAKDLLYADPETFLNATEITMARGEWVGEIEPVTRDGSRKVVEGHWSLVHDDEGRPKSILAINTDITERKQLEQQFLRAQRMESIGTLAGGIAHDLNNVLAPIMMSIDLLRNYITDANGREILNLVGTSARRGAEMVSQVLTFARGVEGCLVDVFIADVVRDLARIIEDTFPKNTGLTIRVDPGLWFVKGDPTQIHQVLLNLCVNARDAMPDGGQITIAAENIMIDDHYAAMNVEASAGPYLMVEVQDTGHGIASEHMEKLFDPFFTTKEVGKGTGLGLSTSLAIIKSHGGFIRAYSDPGMGARFRIYLPANTGVYPVPPMLGVINLPRGNGETILVVDDEEPIRQVTKQTLEAFGYKVLLASDGSEAVSVYVAFQSEIALVLTDVMMPVMDGPATIQVLRRLNPLLKIIGASGISANGKVANAGFNVFLPKPYTAETLLRAIHQLLAE